MPTFFYEARTGEGGVRQTGTVEAASHAAAIETLQRHGLVITRLEDLSARPFLSREIRIPFLSAVAKKDIVIFSRQLAVLFGTHVPLVESLRTLSEQASSKEIRRVVDGLASDVDGGMSLSQALARHPALFSTLYVSIVRSGEVSGKLQEVLDYLAQSLEREYQLGQQIRGALIYPGLVFSVFLGVFILMNIFIIPSLEPVLRESGQQLPLTTRIILGLSGFFRKFAWVFLVAIIAAAVWFFRYISTKEGRMVWHRTQLHLPAVGPLFQNMYVARMSDNLGMLITAGLPITQAIEVTAEVVGNVAFRRVLEEAVVSVRRGESIHGVLRLHPDVVPLMVAQMVAVGEKTGKIDEILGHISRFYKNEVDAAVHNLVSLIEPLLIVMLGIGVAILVAAILLPIYNLAATLQ